MMIDDLLNVPNKLSNAAIGGIKMPPRPKNSNNRGHSYRDIGAEKCSFVSDKEKMDNVARNRRDLFGQPHKVRNKLNRPADLNILYTLPEPEVAVEDERMEKFNPYAAAEFLAGRFEFKVHRGILLIYDKNFGFYKSLLLDDKNRESSFSSFLYEHFPDKWRYRISVTTAKAVYRVLVDNARFSSPFDDSRFEHLVNLQNGVFDILTGEFYEHSPNFSIKVQLRANFVKKPKLSERLSGYFLNLAGGSENLPNLLGAIGMSISNYFGLQKGVFIVGEPRNGKSTLLNFIEREVFPIEFTTSLSSRDLGNSFAPSKLAMGRLSISKDELAVSWSPAAISVFKNVTGQDSMLVQDKCEKHELIEPKCHFVFVSNTLPTFKIRQEEGQSYINALKRRIWYVPTGQSVPDDQVTAEVSEWLVKEKDSVVTRMLLCAHQYILKNLNMPECPREIFVNNDGVFSETPSVGDFVKKVLEKSARHDDWIKMSDLCAAYNDFAGLGELNGLTANSFSRKLRQFVGKECIKKLAAVNASCLIGYRFIRKEGDL